MFFVFFSLPLCLGCLLNFYDRYFHPQDWEILQEMESMNRTKYHELEEEEVDEVIFLSFFLFSFFLSFLVPFFPSSLIPSLQRLSSPQFPSGPEKGLRESGPRTRATLRHTYTIDDGDERKVVIFFAIVTCQFFLS